MEISTNDTIADAVSFLQRFNIFSNSQLLYNLHVYTILHFNFTIQKDF